MTLTVTVDSPILAIAAEIPIKEAKEYLDQKATELNAGFEVSDEGGIIYKFSVYLP